MSSSEMCPDCPIGGRDGSGPVCPHAAACDRQCAELVAVHDVRCGLRRDLMEAAEGGVPAIPLLPLSPEAEAMRWTGDRSYEVHHTGEKPMIENYAIETDALPSMGHTRAEAVGRMGNLARIVAADEVRDVDISTVFCAIPFVDDPLLCYQSLCSGGPLDGECQRYQTRAEAVAGHAELVARAKRETTRSVEVITARWEGDPGQAKEAARLDVAWLLAEVTRLRAALRTTEHEVCQTLGAALGYPHDPEGSGICVGDHVAASLAMEAAARIRGLKLPRG